MGNGLPVSNVFYNQDRTTFERPGTIPLSSPIVVKKSLKINNI
jgi:hypothetical protein